MKFYNANEKTFVRKQHPSVNIKTIYTHATIVCFYSDGKVSHIRRALL